MIDVKDENLTVEFLSLDGKVVIEKLVTGIQMEEGVSFENHSLSKGVYVIRITGKLTNEVRKVVIQ